MRFTLLRAAAAVLVVTAATACAGDLTTSPAIARDASLASISTLPVSPASLSLRAGDVAQLTATPVNPQGTAVAQKSVAWATTNAAVATVSSTGLVSAIAAGSAEIVVTRGAHETRVPVTVDGCGVVAGGMAITGAISTIDCLLTLSNGVTRYSDYYRVTIPNGEVQRFTIASGFAAIYGIKEDTPDPRLGLVHGSTTSGGGVAFRVVGNGEPVQLFVSGANATQLGNYAVTRSVVADAHVCEDYDFILPGATFTTTLTAANACPGTVQFSPFPDAIGKPLLLHAYSFKARAGVTYTLTLSGLTPAFNPAFTLFGFDPATQSLFVIGQSVGAYQPVRSLTFSVSADQYVYPEVASGNPDGNGGWATPAGSYTLSVSR